MPKYNTYTELSAAFKSGELERGYHIILDKGGSSCRLAFWNPRMNDEENDKRSDGCRALFDPDTDEKQHIELLFEALGIPAEWC